MVTSKIILLLRKLSKNELAEFREFLRSPYFNNKSKLTQFYERLIKYQPDFDEKKINRGKIYEAVYPGSKFNAQVYKNLSSELFLLAREFIALQSFKRSETEKDIHILKKLEQSGADELYKIELKAAKKKINESKLDDIIFYHKLVLATIDKMYNFNRSSFKKGIELGAEEGEELLKFYFANIFRLIFDFEVSSSNFKISFEDTAIMNYARKQMNNGIWQNTVDFFEKKKVKNYEIITIYYYTMMSLLYLDNDTYFEKAKELMFKNLNKLGETTRFSVPSSLLTVCTFKINKRGLQSDYQNAFDIINFQLKKKIHKASKDGYITATEFRNTFMIGLQLKQTEWLKKFLKKYINEVSPKQRTSLYNLLGAIIKFYEGNFDEALESANKVKLEQFIYKLDVRKLQLLIFYEQGHFESALSMINSYREFINSNKDMVVPQTRTANVNLMHFVSKLIKLQSDYDEFEALKLQQELNDTEFVLYRSWLKEKMDNLRPVTI